MNITDLPSPTIACIGKYLDNHQSLLSLRHVCKYMYDKTGETQEYWNTFSMANVFVLEQESKIEELFDYLLMYDEETSYFHDALLHLVMNGSVVMIEQNGLNQCRLYIELFFRNLFSRCMRLAEEELEECDVTHLFNTMYLREMAFRSDFWHCIDDLWRVFPRDMLLRLCQQLHSLRDKNGTHVLAYIIRRLMEHGYPLHRMLFLDTMRDFNREDYPEIPATCFGFTILHYLTFVESEEAVRSLLSVTYPFNTTHNSEESRRFDVNKQDRMGRTILSYCSFYGDKLIQIASVLVNEYNADPFIYDVENVSAVMVAHLHKNESIFNFYLQKFGEDKVKQHLQQQYEYRRTLETVEEQELQKLKQVQSETDYSDDEDTYGLTQVHDLSAHEDQDEEDLESDYVGYSEKVPLKDDGFEIKDYNNIFDESSRSSWASEEDRDEEGLSAINIESSLLDPDSLKHTIDLFETVEHSNRAQNSFLFPSVTVNRRKLSHLYNNEQMEEVDEPPSKKRKVDPNSIVSRNDLVIPKEYFFHLVRRMVTVDLPNAQITPLARFTLQHACEVLLTRILSEANHFSLYYARDYVSPIDMKYAIMKMMTRHCNGLPSNQIFTPSLHYAFDDPITNPFPDHQFNVHPEDATLYWIEKNEDLPSISNDGDCRSDLTSVSSDSCASIMQNVPDIELTNTATFDNYVFVATDPSMD
jgi:histone H3/H4